ncbi:MAG TPA: hypothetical protein VKX28_26780 [Xanthobacteraceae bacterium]|nr:hypothetical protein [Xanthobacteraceae bacterium]
MPAPRHLPLGSRLTQDDLAVIGDHVASKLRGEIAGAIRTEFARMGLAVDGDEGLIEVQRDHAFLRAARLRVEDDRATVRRQIITWVVPFVCLALVAGLAAVVGHHFTP